MTTRLLAGAIAALTLTTTAWAAQPAKLGLETVSAPAEFVSGGKVLIRVTGARGPLQVRLNGRDISDDLFGAETGAAMLVQGLRLGENRLTVRDGLRRRTVRIVNHSLEGPILSGPHIKPFICQTQDFKLADGSTLGPPLDANCFAATRVQYMYKPKGAAELKVLADPSATPADADTTSTLSGASAPFVVRVETGVINRAIYQFAVLHDPQSDGPLSLQKPPKGWARRLLAVHGTGCPRGWYVQGAQMGVSPLDVRRLGEGFAVFTSTLNHPTNSCNAVLAGETTLMVRQRVIETLGAPTYTLSMGQSGGAYTSLQVADAFPGLFDGVIASATFPDALVVAIQGSDGRLLNRYFREIAPGALTAAQQQAIGGYAVPIGLQANGNQSGRTDPVPSRQDQQGYASAAWNDAVPQDLRYHPTANPKGARPTVYDALINIYGADPKSGFARRPFDNVGVQYGLKALNDGVITTAQFLDLNARIGGFDQDANYIPARSVGDPQAIARAYQAGVMMSGAGGLKELPILDYSGIYSDLRESGDFHMKHHHFSVRERLRRWNGTADNHVMWSDGGRVQGEPDQTQAEALAAMDRWLIAIANDNRAGTRRERTLRNKPQSLTDGCFTAAPDRRFVAETQVPDGETACNKLYPTHSFPRGVAGTPLSADVLKCALKPLDRADYKTGFTNEEWAQLKGVFPQGVCDWDRPGRGQQPVRPWTRW